MSLCNAEDGKRPPDPSKTLPLWILENLFSRCYSCMLHATVAHYNGWCLTLEIEHGFCASLKTLSLYALAIGTGTCYTCLFPALVHASLHALDARACHARLLIRFASCAWQHALTTHAWFTLTSCTLHWRRLHASLATHSWYTPNYMCSPLALGTRLTTRACRSRLVHVSLHALATRAGFTSQYRASQPKC